jgi:hypothetical protein
MYDVTSAGTVMIILFLRIEKRAVCRYMVTTGFGIRNENVK